MIWRNRSCVYMLLGCSPFNDCHGECDQEQMQKSYDEEYEHKGSTEYEQQLITVKNEKDTLSQQIRKLDQCLMETHQRSELFEIEIAELKQKQTSMV